VSDPLFHEISFSQKIKILLADQKTKYVSDKYDLSPYLKQYSLEEQIPTWFLKTYKRLGSLEKKVFNTTVKESV
jgi:hypothetical protein